MYLKSPYLELGAVVNGPTGSDVMKDSIETAQRAEEFGYSRILIEN